MIPFARKNLRCLILKHASPPVCRSPVSFSFSLLFFSTSSERKLGTSPAIYDVLVHKHHFPPESASRVASEFSLLKNPDPEKADSILSFFKECGFSNSQLEKIVKCRPRFLSASLEDSIKPKIKIFQDLGLSSDGICKLISRNPTILELSMSDNLIPKLSVLKGLSGSNTEVGRVIRYAPRFLTAKLENNVVPNVEFLQSCGVPMHSIRVVLANHPGRFLTKPEAMRKCADKAKEMGLNASSKSFVFAITTLASMSNQAWELKLLAFRNLGFSDGDILTLFRKEPKVFDYSVEKINKVIELLLATKRFSISSIVNCPRSLWCSIEKRYIPRLRILGILESRNLIQEWPALVTICVLTDVKFSDRFIRPYQDQMSDVFGTERSGSGNKGRKP